MSSYKDGIGRRGFVKLLGAAALTLPLANCRTPASPEESVAWKAHEWFYRYLKSTEEEDFAKAYLAAHKEFNYSPPVKLKTRQRALESPENGSELAVFVYLKENIFCRVYLDNSKKPYRAEMPEGERVKFKARYKIKSAGEAAKEKLKELTSGSEEKKSPLSGRGRKRPSQERESSDIDLKATMPKVRLFAYEPEQADRFIASYMFNPANSGMIDRALDIAMGEVDRQALVKRYSEQRGNLEIVYVPLGSSKKDVLDVVLDESTSLGFALVHDGNVIGFEPSWSYSTYARAGSGKPDGEKPSPAAGNGESKEREKVSKGVSKAAGEVVDAVIDIWDAAYRVMRKL